MCLPEVRHAIVRACQGMLVELFVLVIEDALFEKEKRLNDGCCKRSEHSLEVMFSEVVCA